MWMLLKCAPPLLKPRYSYLMGEGDGVGGECELLEGVGGKEGRSRNMYLMHI